MIKDHATCRVSPSHLFFFSNSLFSNIKTVQLFNTVDLSRNPSHETHGALMAMAGHVISGIWGWGVGNVVLFFSVPEEPSEALQLRRQRSFKHSRRLGKKKRRYLHPST